MSLDEAGNSTIMRPKGRNQLGEVRMVDQERWAEIRRWFHKERCPFQRSGGD